MGIYLQNHIGCFLEGVCKLLLFIDINKSFSSIFDIALCSVLWQESHTCLWLHKIWHLIYGYSYQEFKQRAINSTLYLTAVLPPTDFYLVCFITLDGAGLMFN